MLETKLREAFDSMPDGMVLIDAQDRVVAWNRAYERLVPDIIEHVRPGMAYREALAVIARVRQKLSDPAAIEAAVAGRLARRAQIGVPFDSPRPDGGVTQIVELRMPDGGYVINYRDVTAERRATASLAVAKAQAERIEILFRDGIESLADGFMLLDAKDRIVTWNDAYRRLFIEGSSVARVGMTFEEYIRATWAVRRQNDPTVDVDAAIRRRMAAHARVGEPYEIEAVNGLIVRATVHRTSIGGKVVVFRDITSERRALETATGIAGGFREGIESMLDGFAQFDADQGLLNWNRRYIAMFPHLEGRIARGTTLAEIFTLHARSSLYAIAREEEPGWIARVIAAVWESPETNLTRELRDGRSIWGITTRTASGGIIFVLRDVTGRREEEKQLATALERERELSAQQRRFVAVTAHEFRTPLTIIDGAAQRLDRYAERMTPDELRERAGKVRGAVARMAQLIDSTLNLARLDAGQIAMTPGKVDLGALAAASCRRLEGLAAGFVVAVQQPERPVVVTGDAGLLDQIVTNLVTNAIKYSGSSRRAEVSVSEHAGMARLDVVDFGIGIPEAELGQIFARFFRASTAKGLPGTGIGLNLVRELVQLHGGSVALESRVGEGSRFTVTLPLEISADHAMPVADPSRTVQP